AVNSGSILGVRANMSLLEVSTAGDVPAIHANTNSEVMDNGAPGRTSIKGEHVCWRVNDEIYPTGRALPRESEGESGGRGVRVRGGKIQQLRESRLLRGVSSSDCHAGARGYSEQDRRLAAHVRAVGIRRKTGESTSPLPAAFSRRLGRFADHS